MSGGEDAGCEVCGDDLCPGCTPEVTVPRVVWQGLAAFVLLALVIRGFELLPERQRTIDVAPSSTSVLTTEVAVSTSLAPPVESSTTTSSTSSTTTSLLPVPVKATGPLSHPLLDTRPAAIWFWQPSCTLCQQEARYLPELMSKWSSLINFVSVPVNGEFSEQLQFLKRYGIVLPEISDDDGALSSLFAVTGTPTWGFVFPDGTHRTVKETFGAKELERELQALSKSAPLSIIDTSSEAAVRVAFTREFGSVVPELGWTGSTRNCDPGTTSRSHQEATLSRVNWYRAMAGVSPSVTLNDEFSMYAQAAALTMNASGRLSHEPDADFSCMTQWSYEGASRSNLHFGVRGPEAIDGYIEDDGGNNEEVGHRRWILLPELTEIGTGDTNRTNALLVIGGKKNNAATTRERGLVMWPPRGYVPRSTIHTRWSVSAESAFNAGALVVARVSGQTILSERVWPETSVGWPTLVFEIPRSQLRKGPIDIEILANSGDSAGQSIIRYQVIPID